MKRIAVYGSLRKGEYNHRGEFANKATHVANGIIHHAELVGGNAYPWIVASDDANTSVVVEVYDLPDDLFGWIEAMERGAGYERRQVKVELDPDCVGEMDAEAYFYTKPERLADKPRIASGDWSKRDDETD